MLDARGGIRIGRLVNIGSGSHLQTVEHGVDCPMFQAAYAPLEIGDRAWIADGPLIVAGVTIGEGAVVADGAVVTKDVAPYTLVGCLPAAFMRERASKLSYEIDFRKNWL